MSDFGLKDSLLEEDVNTAGVDKLSSSTKYSALKCEKGLFETVEITVNINSVGHAPGFYRTNLLTINHKYQFVPCVLGMANSANYNPTLWQVLPFSYSDAINVNIESAQDNSILYITYPDGITINDILTLKYYILAHQCV